MTWNVLIGETLKERVLSSVEEVEEEYLVKGNEQTDDVVEMTDEGGIDCWGGNSRPTKYQMIVVVQYK